MWHAPYRFRMINKEKNLFCCWMDDRFFKISISFSNIFFNSRRRQDRFLSSILVRGEGMCTHTHTDTQIIQRKMTVGIRARISKFQNSFPRSLTFQKPHLSSFFVRERERERESRDLEIERWIVIRKIVTVSFSHFFFQISN